MFVDTDVDLAPDASFGAAMLARIPFAFPFDLDAGAIDQEVHRALRAAILDVDRKRPLTSGQSAEVRHDPVQSRQSQEAFHKARCLPKRHPEQHFHGQACLNGGITVGRLSAALSGGRSIAIHLGIEPDRQ